MWISARCWIDIAGEAVFFCDRANGVFRKAGQTFVFQNCAWFQDVPYLGADI